MIWPTWPASPAQKKWFFGASGRSSVFTTPGTLSSRCQRFQNSLARAGPGPTGLAGDVVVRAGGDPVEERAPGLGRFGLGEALEDHADGDLAGEAEADLLAPVRVEERVSR